MVDNNTEHKQLDLLSGTKLNVPNILTIIRLVCSPVFLPFLIVYILPYNIFWLNCFIAAIFGFFALTDFFDGYLARKFKQETTFGQVLDPIADKFLLYTTLVSLLAAEKIFFYWVIILIGREIFMMGLRRMAVERNFLVQVSLLGKSKTVLQMITLLVIIINPYQDLGLRGALGWNGIELLLLIFTLFISVVSAERYYRSFLRSFNEQHTYSDSTDYQL